MRKNAWKVLLCLALVFAALACTALAADGLAKVEATGATISITDGVLSVSYSGSDLKEGGQYALLMVKLENSGYDADNLPTKTQVEAITSDDYGPVSDSNVLYINQDAEDSGVSFGNVKPKNLTTSVLLLGGEFEGSVSSPKVLGVIVTDGVTVSGQVTSYKPTATTTINLYASTDTAHADSLYSTTVSDTTHKNTAQTQEFGITGVVAGTYDMVVTKPGNLDYVVKGIVVGSDPIDLKEATGKAYANINLIAGDMTVDRFNAVNGQDLLAFRSEMTHRGEAIINKAADIDGNGAVNSASDLLPFRASYGKTSARDCTVTYVAP